MAKQDQITTHFCIQGWSGVAEWGGVPMLEILDLVKPMPEARYAVFYSLADGGDGGRYYDVHKIENMRHALTILAYEMNGAPVSVVHGWASRWSSDKLFSIAQRLLILLKLLQKQRQRLLISTLSCLDARAQ